MFRSGSVFEDQMSCQGPAGFSSVPLVPSIRLLITPLPIPIPTSVNGPFILMSKSPVHLLETQFRWEEIATD